MDPTTPAQTQNATTTEAAEPVADGVLEGGWGYIWSAYGITWTGLLLYTAYVIIRRSLQKSGSRSAAP